LISYRNRRTATRPDVLSSIKKPKALQTGAEPIRLTARTPCGGLPRIMWECRDDLIRAENL
jgi:hypothetical protein